MATLNFVFRVDASTRIGTGHVMRCLTLANELRQYGAESYFICRAHSGHMAKEIEAEGHNIMLLPSKYETGMSNDGHDKENYALWLGESLVNDANETIQHLIKVKPKWIIVDHFAINSVWEMRVKEEIDLNIMVIDGLADRKHECDLLMDQTYSPQGEARWENLVPKGCKLFVGPKYALLRPEFIEARQHLRKRDGKVKRIFIAFGGIDELDATSITLEALGELNKKDISIDVIIGIANPNKKILIEKYGNIDNVNIYVNPDNIAGLMAAADLAIGGGGTMMWERCLLRLPTLIISIAKNQINLAKSLHLINAAVYIGEITSTTSESIRNNIDELINNKNKLIEIQNASGKLMSQDSLLISKYLLENT